MEESYSTRPLVGRWVALDVRPTRPLTWLGPSWAVICGALASGGLAFQGHAVLSLILALLTCDALFGAWRTLWLQTDWRDALRHAYSNAQGWLQSEIEPPTGWARVSRHASLRLRYIRKVIWPIVDSEITGLAIVGALALCLAIIMGQIPFVLTVVAMAFSVVEGRFGIARGAWLRAFADIAFPWLIAETALGPFTWVSLAFTLLFSFVYRSLMGLATTRGEHWIALSNLSQLVIVLILVASNMPAGAGIALLGLLAQILWQARYRSDRDGQSYARRVQSYVLVAMLMAALSIWF